MGNKVEKRRHLIVCLGIFLGYFFLNLAFLSRDYSKSGLGNCLAIEEGTTGISNAPAHILYGPVLLGYSKVLAFFGYAGRIAIPAQIASLIAASGTLVILYVVLVRLTGHLWGAFWGALLMGFSHGFWRWSMQPKGYVFAELFLLLLLLVLLKPARSWPSYAVMGGLSALAVFFTLAALPILAVVAVMALSEQALWIRLRNLFIFLAVSLGIILVGYLEFVNYFDYPASLSLGITRIVHNVSPMAFPVGIRVSYFHTRDLAEQVKTLGQQLLDGYSNAGLMRFGWDLEASRLFQGAVVALFLLILLPLLVSWLTKTGRDRFWNPFARPLAVLGLWGLAFGGFFLINDSRNDFVYIALFPLFPLIGIWASVWRPALRLLVLFCALLFSYNFMYTYYPQHLTGGNSLPNYLAEGEWLASHFKGGDVIVTIGPPDMTVKYFWGESRRNPGGFQFYSLGLSGRLKLNEDVAAFIWEKLKEGKSVMLAAPHSFYEGGLLRPSEKEELRRRVRAFLRTYFRVEPYFASPEGEYWEVSLLDEQGSP